MIDWIILGCCFYGLAIVLAGFGKIGWGTMMTGRDLGIFIAGTIGAGYLPVAMFRVGWVG